MTIYSGPVVSGMDATSAQYNRLRRDMLQHCHDGETTRISHGQLQNGGKQVDTTYSHAEIDSHIDAIKGVHSSGDSNAYVVLSGGGQFKIQTGTLKWTTGGKAWTPQGPTGTAFPYPFSGVPLVIAQQYADDGDPLADRLLDISLIVTEATPTGFVVEAYDDTDQNRDLGVYWMAVGT